MSNRWFRRCLSVCPPAIALLWMAGVAGFHGLSLAPVQWAIYAAALFALQSIWRQLSPPRPLALPKGTNPVALTALVAAIVAVPFALIAAVFEVLVDPHFPSATSLALRCLWHGACAYAAAYCAWLLRLTAARSGAPAA